MVLRKPSPLPDGAAQAPRPSMAPYPVTPTSETPPAPNTNAFISPSQIFSQTLHDSPAFRLESLGEAQRSPTHTTENPWANESPRTSQKQDIPPRLRVTSPKNGPEGPMASGALSPLPLSLRAGNGQDRSTPRSSSESDRSQDEDWWDRDDEVPERPTTRQTAMAATPPKPSNWTNNEPETMNPFADFSPNEVKRKPVPPQGSSEIPPAPTAAPPPLPSPSFGSKNPFRRNLSTDMTGSSTDRKSLGSSPGDESPIPKASANLSAPDVRVADFSSSYTPAATYQQDDPPSPVSTFSQSDHMFSTPHTRPPLPAASPPDPPRNVGSPYHEQPPLIPVASEMDQSVNPWTGSQESGFGNNAAYASPATTFPQGSNQTPSLPVAEHPSLTDLIDTSTTPTSGPSMDLPIRSTHPEETSAAEETLPSKPPRPTVQVPAVSAMELNRLQNQRSETYQIKHFNWLDPKTKALRRSSMLTQNKNGPCPLLALVNALVLTNPESPQSALEKALDSREQISLGLLIESLMDELTSDSRNTGIELPDVDDLNRFLLTLHTGLNANPKFAAPAKPINLMDARNSILHLPSGSERAILGGFEMTSDIRLYGAFDVPLIHGWIPSPSHPASGAFLRSAHTYEDAQTIMFGEEELEVRLSNHGLSPVEQQMFQDIVTIKDFFKAYPTQLTPYGLELVQHKMTSGSFSILFRNDHFSTLFKHPESGQVFTLVTDAGYATHEEVIWESLVDVSGQGNEMFSGDFRPVGNTPEPIRSAKVAPSSGHSRSRSDNLAAPRSPEQEQADADFALALQLQDEEEQQAETARRNRASTASTQSQPANTGRRPTIPQQQDIRPMIPPRTSRQSVSQGVNRPTDDSDDAPPPSYDEAAKGRPYIPPGGINSSPAAPSGQYVPNSSPSQPGMGGPHLLQNPGRIQGHLGQPFGPHQMVGHGGRQRDRDRDCIVM